MRKTIDNSANAIAAAFLAVVCVSCQDVAAAIKCWKNHEGVKECGTQIPPEFAQQGHEKLSRHGTKENVERAPTKEELLQMEEEKHRMAEQEKLLADERKKDESLLHVYSTVKDLERARDEKILSLEGNSRFLTSQIEKLQQRLDRKMDLITQQEKSGHEVSRQLYQDVESIRRQIQKSSTSIEELREQIQVVNAEFSADIARFKKLKGVTSTTQKQPQEQEKSK